MNSGQRQRNRLLWRARQIRHPSTYTRASQTENRSRATFFREARQKCRRAEQVLACGEPHPGCSLTGAKRKVIDGPSFDAIGASVAGEARRQPFGTESCFGTVSWGIGMLAHVTTLDFIMYSLCLLARIIAVAKAAGSFRWESGELAKHRRYTQNACDGVDFERERRLQQQCPRTTILQNPCGNES